MVMPDYWRDDLDWGDMYDPDDPDDYDDYENVTLSCIDGVVERQKLTKNKAGERKCILWIKRDYDSKVLCVSTVKFYDVAKCYKKGSKISVKTIERDGWTNMLKAPTYVYSPPLFT